MSKFVSKPRAMDLRKIVRLGANPGYFQLENGEVVNLSHHCDVKEGDYILFVDGEPVDIMTQGEVYQEAFELDSDIDPLSVEDQVDSVEFVDGDPQTLCAITMKDGRKFAGSVVKLDADEEQRREWAYAEALTQAFSEEVRFLQRLHHYYHGGL